jgi:hypothetical protein
MFLFSDDRVKAEKYIDFMLQLYFNLELNVLDTKLKGVHKVLLQLFDHWRCGLIRTYKFSSQVLDEIFTSFVSEIVIKLIF